MRRPSWDMSIFKKRRERLAQVTAGAAVVIPANPEHLRNPDVHHPYRQDSNFFYLTGFEEPDSVLVFRPGKTPEYTLFVRAKDPLKEIWDGFRYGPVGAEAEFGVDKAYPTSELEKVLPELLKDCDRVFYRLLANPSFDGKLKTALDTVRVNQGRSGMGLLPIHDVSEILGEMRVKKVDEELDFMRKACQISAEGHIAGMRFTKPGVNERQVAATIEYTFRMKGSPRDGYHPIVASGAAATTLHYNFNDQECRAGDFLLIDAGAEYGYYTGDITRTFPVSGKFTDSQRKFYGAVLEIQKKLVEKVKPGVQFNELINSAVSLLTNAMLELGLLKGAAQMLIDQSSYKKYYPHGVGHWLGMDVHDVGLYKRGQNSRTLEPGMCLTIEPGLYVPYDDLDAPEEYRGMGVRIEDNILVTENGHENLTSLAPKEIADIEAIVGADAKLEPPTARQLEI